MSVGLVGFAGQMETPGGSDSGPQAVCWTLFYTLSVLFHCDVDWATERASSDLTNPISSSLKVFLLRPLGNLL